MSELAPIIADLALILILAGAMTILFKKLKQPLVLGYIVAGFLASPHFGLLPSVVDTANVHTWADIGVIFLLFALGLEFSFKKIMKVGGPAIIAALTIIIGMIFLGITVGTAFGWKKMDAIFLGGMIAMSSTTIIYKAFEDLGLSKKQFASLVLSILILEDILAVVLMVMLSTMAVSNSVEGMEMLQSILKLVFFLVLWVVVGLYIVPLFLKWARKLMNEETLLVVSLGLCFGMVVIAAKTGFSAAFGAFIMGSILAETVESEKIEKLVKPVKDLFGAIFFVSVGMMVDPAMIVQYAVPIIVITLTVLVGQATFATLGVIFSGQSLKTAMQCGFSLTQIGEFAFIIASLGVSLGVTSDFLYPIVVAVSVITIFLTPYMIRLAEPAYALIEKHLPDKWKSFLGRYASGSAPAASKENYWKKYLLEIAKFTLVYSIICFAIILIGTKFVEPLLKGILPGIWGDVVAVVAMIIFMSPFLRSIMIKKN
ncbi:MAG: cation:proton antiporter, partial [Bacteroidales bacterium]|nr:cation:proton antiporter [Bacteroidales bacterium]